MSAKLNMCKVYGRVDFYGCQEGMRGHVERILRVLKENEV